MIFNEKTKYIIFIPRSDKLNLFVLVTFMSFHVKINLDCGSLQIKQIEQIKDFEQQV